MAVFVYPWWATFLNFAIAAYLTVYLVRTYHICIYSFIPIPNVLINTTKTQQKRQQATHLRRVVLCHIGRFRMLLGIGSLYQLPLWFQAAKDLIAGYRAGHLGTPCVIYMSSIMGPRGTEIPSHARTHAPTHSMHHNPPSSPIPKDLLPALPLSLVCALGLTGSLGLGGALYSFHLPERLAPGKFDNVRAEGNRVVFFSD